MFLPGVSLGRFRNPPVLQEMGEKKPVPFTKGIPALLPISRRKDPVLRATPEAQLHVGTGEARVRQSMGFIHPETPVFLHYFSQGSLEEVAEPVVPEGVVVAGVNVPVGFNGRTVPAEGLMSAESARFPQYIACRCLE